MLDNNNQTLIFHLGGMKTSNVDGWILKKRTETSCQQHSTIHSQFVLSCRVPYSSPSLHFGQIIHEIYFDDLKPPSSHNSNSKKPKAEQTHHTTPHQPYILAFLNVDNKL